MKPLKHYAILFVILLSGCAHGPEVTVCISRPDSGGFVCADSTESMSKVMYKDTNRWVAFSESDAQKLIDSCKINNVDRRDQPFYLDGIANKSIWYEDDEQFKKMLNDGI